MIEPWRRAWRALAAQMTEPGLRALLHAIQTDSPDLLQGGTCLPPPMWVGRDQPVEQACATVLPFWRGDGLLTVEEADNAFSRATLAANVALGDTTGVAPFLGWYDYTPRAEVLKAMEPEVRFNLGEGPDPTKEATCSS